MARRLDVGVVTHDGLALLQRLKARVHAVMQARGITLEQFPVPASANMSDDSYADAVVAALRKYSQRNGASGTDEAIRRALEVAVRNLSVPERLAIPGRWLDGGGSAENRGGGLRLQVLRRGAGSPWAHLRYRLARGGRRVP